MLQIDKLSFDYQDRPLLHNVDFQLVAGDLLHLKGGNGVGKTTLLKLIAGLYHPVQGAILYQGTNIHQQLSLYQHDLCYLGHKTGISPYLTVKENCHFDLHYDEACDLLSLLALFNLEPYVNTPCGLLSAGQCRQIGLLRLWGTKARIWLLDEPLVALDDHALSVVSEKIKQHCQRGGLVVVTSHQLLALALGSYQEYSL